MNFKLLAYISILSVTLLLGCEKDDESEVVDQGTVCLDCEDLDSGVGGQEAGSEAGSEAGQEQLDCAPEFEGADGCDEPLPVDDPACEPCEGENCQDDCEEDTETQPGEEDETVECESDLSCNEGQLQVESCEGLENCTSLEGSCEPVYCQDVVE